MILDLVQEVREVSVLALLLEWAGHMLTEVVVHVIHLFSPQVFPPVEG